MSGIILQTLFFKKFKKLFYLTIKSRKFPSQNGITLTRNVLLPGSLSSIRHLSLFSITFPFFLEVAHGTVSTSNNIQLFR